MRNSENQLDFLDVNVRLSSNNQLSTELYEKDTNAYMYLHNSSNHPVHTKNKIAYGLALRAKRICSENEKYVKCKEDIARRLMSRGHKKSKVEK